MRRKFNDGQYHHVQFTRTGSSATLRVDDLPLKQIASSSAGQFIFMPVCHFTAEAVLNIMVCEHITLHWLPNPQAVAAGNQGVHG